jgi:hypothetical protein
LFVIGNGYKWTTSSFDISGRISGFGAQYYGGPTGYMGLFLPDFTLPGAAALNAVEIDVSGWAYYLGHFKSAAKEGEGVEFDEDGEIFRGTMLHGCRKEGVLSRLTEDRRGRVAFRQSYEVYRAEEEGGFWADRLISEQKM